MRLIDNKVVPSDTWSWLRVACLVVIAFFALAAPKLNAQVLYGSIVGTVQDKTGAVIPGSVITVTNQGTGDIRTATANQAGVYSLLDMLPGTYTVTVPASGNFASNEVKNIDIEVNRQVRVDVTLQPGTVATEVTVTNAAPPLQTESGEVNAEISSEQINQLPITSSQGRSYQALYTLIPGAAGVAEQNSTASNPSRSMSLNVNGTSYNGNTTRIDGAVNYYGWLPYLIAYVSPADSVENVSVTTNSFNAEQGQAGGSSIKVTTKSGTRDFHGSLWEYYQDANINARPYTTTYQASPTLPKNIFNQYGFNIGGPVYIPKILTGKKKLFFFDNFERTTRRQLISGFQTVPDTNMINGNFSEAASYTTIYDPAPVLPYTAPAACPTPIYSNGYLVPQCRPSFTQEYNETGSNVNTIPASRIAFASSTMIANLAPISATIAPPSSALITSGMANDYFGTGTFAYNRNTNDAKVTYIPNETTQIFGKYSIEPFNNLDPQQLKAAGGGTFDGGQPGAGAGRIQNVGLGMSHVFTPSLVLDADFGYTRQVTGAQSLLDISLGDYGLNQLKIPGTNGIGPNYVGQPVFSFNSTFSSMGNSNTANPFLFRDNQFTGDVNLSWIVRKHTMKYGFTYYHFDLNHFQPTSGGGVSNVRGGFLFAGGMTCTGTASSCPATAYNTLADYLLGLPNSNGTGNAVQKAQQVYNPNAMRWTTIGAYAQDQWSATPKLVVNYGVRYEYYPVSYRDHTGLSLLDPTLPQTANVLIGGVNGIPKDAGVSNGYGFFAPRLGLAYRINEKTVIRSGFGLTVDPDSMRYLRDSFPWDLDPNYTSAGTGTIAYDPANGNAPMTLSYGIPIPVAPNLSTGVISLPVSGSTTTIPKNFRRGYIESWNLFLQRDLGHGFVANAGYVGDHFVRQQAGVSPYNAAPLASGNTSCMANGQYNPSTGLTGACNGGFQDNTIFSQTFCKGTSNCYNSGGVNVSGPTFTSNYNALQTQLTRIARNSTLGVVYTWSHAMDFEDNGAGSGSAGTTFNYPAYYNLNYGNAGYDRKHNVQVFGVYKLPFGYGQKFANQGFVAQIVGGFQLNGQFSHYSGAPFSVSSNSNLLGGFAPGFGATYAELVAPYQQLGGHNRVFGNTAVSGGRAWFNPASFASVTEPTYTAAMTPAQINASPLVLPNTGRNEWRGPGQSVFNASLYKSIKVYRESEFQIRFEAFNVFNHPQLTNPGNLTVPTATNIASGNYGTFGLITSFGAARSLQFGGRFNF